MQALIILISVFCMAILVLCCLECYFGINLQKQCLKIYKAHKFESQILANRDRKFSLFPLSPKELLYDKQNLYQITIDALREQVRFQLLFSLFVAILITGVYLLMVGNLAAIDKIVLFIFCGLFGLGFLSKEREIDAILSKGNIDWGYTNPKDKFRSKLPAFKRIDDKGNITISLIVYSIFVVVLPIAIIILMEFSSIQEINPSEKINSESTQFQIGSTVLTILIGDSSTQDEGGLVSKISWMFQLAKVTVFYYPFVLFIFYSLEIRTFLKRAILEEDEIGISSFSRIKNLISWIISLLLTLFVLDVDLSNFSLFSGLAAAGLSVAMRESITNFISGIQMSWDRSLKVGDVVSIPQGESSDTGSTYGIVRDIRNRYTVIEDRNTVRRLVPNSLLVSQPIEHWTHEDSSVRLSIRVGIAYVKEAEKVRQAQRIMESVCYDVPRVLTHKPPNALLISYGESELIFSLRFWIDDAQNGIRPVISEVLISLYERLNAAKITIPFPQQDMHIKELPPVTLKN